MGTVLYGVLTGLNHDVSNPDEDGRHKPVSKQKMVVCCGTECGRGSLRPLQRQFQLDGAADNIVCRYGRYTERQFLACSFIIRVNRIKERRPMRRHRCIDLKAARNLGRCFQDLLHQLDPVVGTPSVDTRILVVIPYTVGHNHRHFHTAKTLCRKFRNLFLDKIVIVLTSRGIGKPHTRHWLCMGIRGKETLNDSLAIMHNLAEP